MSLALQPFDGPIRSRTYLPADPAKVLWGRLPCASDVPVLTIEPGTEVTIDTISHEGILEDQGRDPFGFFTRHGATEVLDDAIALAASDYDRKDGGPHVITGPIRIEGARPGDLLRMHVVETLQRVPYGVISSRQGSGTLPAEYPAAAGTVSVFASSDGEWGHLRSGTRDVRFALHPFLGIMGVAVAGTRRPSSIAPGAHGGNLSLKILTAGASLYLPVQVDGALAYVGSPRYAQGDGMVALTAMEAPLRVTILFDVVYEEDAVERFGLLAGALAENAEFLVPTGIDLDLDVAVQDCVLAAISVLQARWGLDSAHAYSYLSAATDFNITQVVNVVKGVHARIRKSDFEH